MDNIPRLKFLNPFHTFPPYDITNRVFYINNKDKCNKYTVILSSQLETDFSKLELEQIGENILIKQDRKCSNNDCSNLNKKNIIGS